ncbi:hypothetical protein RHMOL_Rhmol04G0000700 [Rhododendron molle]|uniref:Uncharacterized protein n=1 Tax=Rhododendron molle TaxID=49168 RepID=A0ACC0NX23_RHOML|nr:hypothetical protein RHMOL_Rhmol04G0000700 [Rhododendron molle]
MLGLRTTYIAKLLECFTPGNCLSTWQEIHTMFVPTCMLRIIAYRDIYHRGTTC